MSNTTTCPAVKRFMTAARRVERQIKAFAAGTDIDTLPLLESINRLESGRKSLGHAVAAVHGYSSAEMTECYSRVTTLRCAVRDALESAIENRAAARKAEIAAIDADLARERAERNLWR